VINYIKLLKDPVAFHRIYATLGGGAAAGVFISQLMYWHGTMKKTHGENWNGWFYKKGSEWEEETGVTRHEREKTEKLLKRLEIIKIKKKGTPPTKNYKVDEYLFNKAIEDLMNGRTPSSPSKDAELQDTAKQNAESGSSNGEIQQNKQSDMAVQTGKSGDSNGEISPYITEITTETTSETTTQTLCASEKTEDATNENSSGESEKKEPWVSSKGKALTGKKLEIFEILWEAFDYKTGRAPSIDQYLAKIFPMFGTDAETNRTLLKTLLASIKIHVKERKASDGSASPLHFKTWIHNRRWEDTPVTLQSSQAESGASIEQEWSKQGFKSSEEYQAYDLLRIEYRQLTKLPTPSASQVELINSLFDKLTAMKPAPTQGKAA